MKKAKFLTFSLLVSAFTLASCYADLGFVKFGKPEETNSTSIGGKTTNNNNSSSGGNQTTGGSLLETLKAKAKTIAAKVYSKSESSITFAEYEDENAEADVYYYDSPTLTFIDIEDYEESFGESFVNRMKGYLPSGATFYDSNDDTEYEDYGYIWYDRYYAEGELTYNIWAKSSDAFEYDGESYSAETSGAIVIYKTSQQSAFDAYFSLEE